MSNLHKILDYNEDNYIKYLNSVMYKFLSCSTQHTKYFLKEDKILIAFRNGVDYFYS